MLNDISSGNSIFISVVSHNHFDIINKLSCLKQLAEKYNVVVKNNIDDPKLVGYCQRNNLYLIDRDYYRGFGANNNIAYQYCVNSLGMKEDDFFIVLNPDLLIDGEDLDLLLSQMINERVDVATINLYKNIEFTDYDESIRRFPSLWDFVSSLMTGRNKTKIDKSRINAPTIIDWCAGSFIAFKSHVFLEIGGFDIKYFMYCEDVDLCFRLMKKNIKLVYYPNVKALHMAQHENRKLFSKHFVWHIKSALRFILVKNNLIDGKKYF